jgi:hypothetical protein
VCISLATNQTNTTQHNTTHNKEDTIKRRKTPDSILREIQKAVNIQGTALVFKTLLPGLFRQG